MITIEQNIITVTVENQAPVIDVLVTPPPAIELELSNQMGMPAGGQTGEYLRKRSANNYDTEWSQSAASYYTHNQESESAEWIVNHNLGRYPVIAVLSIGLMKVMADVAHMSANQARVYFAQPHKGLAQCS